MTAGKTLALTAGFAATLAAGIWIGTFVTSRDARVMPDATAVHSTESVSTPAPAVTPAAPARRAAIPESRVKHDATTFAPVVATVPVDAPALHKRLKPLLKSGANMALASDGFKNAEDFAAVVHASQNTDLPFMLLKHRVVEEGKTLTDAIRESKPQVNAGVEADRARAEARADLASIG